MDMLANTALTDMSLSKDLLNAETVELYFTQPQSILTESLRLWSNSQFPQTTLSNCAEGKHGAASREDKHHITQGELSYRYLVKGKMSVTFAHDLFLGVGLLIQDAQLIIAIYEHDARVIAVFHGALILLYIININFNNHNKNNLTVMISTTIMIIIIIMTIRDVST